MTQQSSKEPHRASSSTAICTSYLLMLAWILLSATVILFNKYVVSMAGFPYPISLTLIHMAFCSVLSAALIKLGGCVGIHVEPVKIQFDIFLRHVVPVGVLFSVVLWLSNAVYLYLSVSFIQMLKASMPVAVFLVSILLRTAPFSHRIALNMAWIGAGIAIASYGEVNFIWIGVFYQVVSIFCESFRLILIQVLMQQANVRLNSIQTMYYVSPCCFLCLLMPYTILEAPKLYADKDINLNPLLLLSNAACAFCLNVAVYRLIGATSALTLNVAGVVKDWLLIILSVALFGSPVSGLSLFGYLIAFAGVKYYNNQHVADMKSMVEAKDASAKQVLAEPLLQHQESHPSSPRETLSSVQSTTK